MSLTRDQVLALQKRGLRDWIAAMAASSPGAELFERDCVAAAIVPAVSRRSIPNSASYSDAAALADNLDALAERYGQAGVEAWTVWVPEFDREAIELLERAGHEFDGHPAAMALELDGWTPPELGDLDWDVRASGDDIGRVNDAAYGFDAGDGYAASLAAPPENVRVYQAREDGEVACVAGTIDHDDDLGFYFVATHPDHQRKGLTTRLMAAALVDARERGLRTSSLQASPPGEPVYRRLGYESPFRLNLYERRPPIAEPEGRSGGAPLLRRQV